MTSLVFDIETNGLLLTVDKFWCGVTYCIETKEYREYRPHQLQELIEDLQAADCLIGHNICGYDIPALEKLGGLSYKGCLIDTILLSKLEKLTLWQDDMALVRTKKLPKKLLGSHSLGAWGYRLGLHKGDYNDWSKFTESMLAYCVQDVKVTTKLYNKLIKGDTPLEALQLEQDVQRIITKQHMNGWKFDVKKAQALHVELLEIMEPLEKEILEVFKPKFLPDGKTKIPKKEFRRLGIWTMGEHQPIKLRDFNPNSSNHIIWWLQHDFGWEPVDFTEKGAPKTGADTLRELPYQGITPLLNWLDANKLLTMLAEGDNAWLKKVDYTTERIHGSADILGAATGRFTHSRPNLAQVPSSTAFMGERARELFTVENDYTLVGADASGLELRVLAHFMAKFDNGEYGDIVVGGDIHTTNQNAAGLPTRNMAKTFIYGLLYGAGDAKIGSIVDKDAKEGARLKRKFFSNTPAMSSLTKAVQTQVLPRNRGGLGRKTLNGLSGRKLHVRSPHSALNLVLQSAGAYYMKYWLVEVDRRARARGFDYRWVGNIHDEAQAEVLSKDAGEFASMLEQAFIDVGYMIGMRCKMEGEAKLGRSWKDTH